MTSRVNQNDVFKNPALKCLLQGILEILKEEVRFSEEEQTISLANGAYFEAYGETFRAEFTVKVKPVVSYGATQLSVGTEDEWEQLKDTPVDEEKTITLTAAATASEVTGKIIPDFDIGHYSYSGDKEVADDELTVEKLDKARASAGNLVARSSFDLRDTMLGKPWMQDPEPEPEPEPESDPCKTGPLALIPTRRRWDYPPEKMSRPESLQETIDRVYGPKVAENYAAGVYNDIIKRTMIKGQWRSFEEKEFRQEMQMDPGILEELKQERAAAYAQMCDESGEVSIDAWKHLQGLKYEAEERERAIDQERAALVVKAKIAGEKIAEEMAAASMAAVHIAAELPKQSSEWYKRHWMNYVRDGDGDMTETFMSYIARINKETGLKMDPAEMHKHLVETMIGPAGEENAPPDTKTMTDRLQEIMERHRARSAQAPIPAPNDWEVRKTEPAPDAVPDPAADVKAEPEVDYSEITRRMF